VRSKAEKAESQLNLPHGTKNKKNRKFENKKTTKTQKNMFRKTVRSRISPESVMREEESLWWEGFVRQVGFKPGMKD